MAPPSTPQDLIGLTEAARLLGVSRWLIRDAVRRGDIPGYRVGRLWKVSARDARRLVHPIEPDGGAS